MFQVGNMNFESFCIYFTHLTIPSSTYLSPSLSQPEMYHTVWCQILWLQHWHSDNTLEPWNETSPVQQYPKPCNKNIIKLYLFTYTRHSIMYEYGSNCTCNLTRVSSTVNLQVKNDAPIVGLMWWLNILPIYLKTMLVLPTPRTHHKVRLRFHNQHFNQTVLTLYWGTETLYSKTITCYMDIL